jgi:dihydroneopterin aldolase
MLITVHKLEFLGRHGVYDEERRQGRRFQVDLTVRIQRPTSSNPDALATTLDYRELSRIILTVGHGPSMNLIEHMAEQILDQVLLSQPLVEWGRVRVRKFATGVPGDPQWVGVEIERDR